VERASDDGRTLGVQLWGMSVECTPTDEPGAPARTTAIPLGGSPDAWFVGFHPVERSSDASWRWTKERSKVELRERALPKGEQCLVNLALGGPSRRSVAVSWNGSPLTERTKGTFPIVRSRDHHRVTLSSRTRPRPGVAQPVGVGLWRVGFQCGGPIEP
jgi:hypothetical protein